MNHEIINTAMGIIDAEYKKPPEQQSALYRTMEYLMFNALNSCEYNTCAGVVYQGDFHYFDESNCLAAATIYRPSAEAKKEINELIVEDFAAWAAYNRAYDSNSRKEAWDKVNATEKKLAQAILKDPARKGSYGAIYVGQQVYIADDLTHKVIHVLDITDDEGDGEENEQTEGN